MNRLEIIQTLIGRIKANTYLEIGVFKADVFHKVRAKRKIAIDPKFQFGRIGKLSAILMNISNTNSVYFEMTSDKFFSDFANNELKSGIDVAFIDGLHTYAQSLKDVENCLKYLNEGGYIVIHDCNPPHAAAAYPADSIEHARQLNLPGWTGEWCGDVYKTIAYLRSQREDLDVSVIDCDYGVGVLKKGKPLLKLNMVPRDIDSMDYSFFSSKRREILNLLDPSIFEAQCRNI